MNGQIFSDKLLLVNTSVRKTGSKSYHAQNNIASLKQYFNVLNKKVCF